MSQHWRPRFVLCLVGGIVLGLTVAAVTTAQQKPASRKPATEKPAAEKPVKSEAAPMADIPAEEKPFWESAQAYVNAYASRDGEALGKLFTADAEFVTELGETTKGRDGIVALFEDVFETSPEIVVEGIEIQRVRFISDTVALEEGRVTTSESTSTPPQTSRYIAIHIKEKDGVWRINTLKDFATTEDEGHPLAALAWMVGDWVSEDSSSDVVVDCNWSEDGHFLIWKFTVKMADQAIMNGVQRIGWDPIRKEIRSWVFDSEGGYVEGTWKQNGYEWLVTSTGYTAQGESAVGVTIYTVHDSERISWQRRSMVLGNELQEQLSPIVMVRRPPPPTISE